VHLPAQGGPVGAWGAPEAVPLQPGPFEPQRSP
jgi:hypothetical protein